jgi:EAL domain-containing protein (putative c-di-GMP-specific phosphodiesterase class I)
MRDHTSNSEFSLPTLAETHKRRVRLTLHVGAYAMIFLGIIWGAFFYHHGALLIVAMDVLVTILGAITLALTKKNYIRIASYLMLTSLFVILCTSMLFLDIPNAYAPRSQHHFLFTLAFCAYLILQDERKWIRLGFSLAFILAYLVFASSTIGIPSIYAVPDSIRIGGSWFNNFMAIFILCLVVYIMLSDFAIRSQLELDLGKALVMGNQLELHYQPQVNREGVVYGSEALVRWHHPERGLVAPDEFIPLAERTGMIIPLGHWVLNTACTQLATWAASTETAHLTVSVNISALQFRQANFLEQVLSVVERTDIDPTKLKLEVTENIMIENVDSVIMKMQALNATGITISLDDFGISYSSLSYLKRLPLDQLKIDRSFVTDILSNTKDAAIARTITALARDLNLMVIAEGVENEAQLNYLMANGCFAFQGFLISKALPINEFNYFVCDNRVKLLVSEAASKFKPRAVTGTSS